MNSIHMKFQHIDEVNSRLPEVQHVFEQIDKLNEQSIALTKDISVLFDIWGESLRKEKNPDFAFYRERKERKRMLGHSILQEMEKIRLLGGVVKNVQRGLVDFYFERESGEGVCLCWKRGDKKIRHWHPVQSSGRRPIQELLQARQV